MSEELDLSLLTPEMAQEASDKRTQAIVSSGSWNQCDHCAVLEAEVQRLRDRVQWLDTHEDIGDTMMEVGVALGLPRFDWRNERCPPEWNVEKMSVTARRVAARLSKAEGALRVARQELDVAASYAEDPTIALGLKVHARACKKALEKVDAALALTPPPQRGKLTMTELGHALAELGESETGPQKGGTGEL